MEEQENFGESEEFNELVDILLEKEITVQHLDQSKDFMDASINKLESEITKAIAKEWTDTTDNMLLKQHKRNRSIIKEIITTCQTFKGEIAEEFTNLRGEDDDAWVIYTTYLNHHFIQMIIQITANLNI